MKNLAGYLCVLFFLFVLVGCLGESGREEPSKDVHELYDKVLKERERSAHPGVRKADTAWKKREAARVCAEQYLLCIGRCSDRAGERACSETLTACQNKVRQPSRPTAPADTVLFRKDGS